MTYFPSPLPLAVALLAFCSCSSRFTPAHGDYGSSAPNPSYRQGDPLLTESLFDYKDRTLSEEDIRRILDGKIPVRDSIRLAVFSYGGSLARYGAWNWYDEESLNNQQQLLDTLTYTLTRSPRLGKVILLPALVTGSKPNIHQLRESAVRVQADMLLVYSLHSDVFQKYRVFKKDEVKAFATCETVLMDIRTGIIPHTNIATKSAKSAKEQEDFAAEELQKRALQQAALDALLETGNKVAVFLNEQR